jgi:hypothetical protein
MPIMTAKNFSQVLQRLALERPFRPFTVELIGGETFEVDFPTAVRDGAAVFIAQSGVPIIFGHQDVLAIHGGTASASA